MNAVRSLRIVPTGEHLGADIFGLDLTKPLDEETLHAMEDGWRRYRTTRAGTLVSGAQKP